MKEDSQYAQKALLTMLRLFLYNQDLASDKSGQMVLVTLDIFFDFMKLLKSLPDDDKQQDEEVEKKREAIKKYLEGCKMIITWIINYDYQHFEREDQVKIYKKIKEKILSRIDNIDLITHIDKIIEPLFYIDKNETDKDFSDIASSSSSNEEEDTSKKKVKIQVVNGVHVSLKMKVKKEEKPQIVDKDSESDGEEEEKSSLLFQGEAFFGENQKEYLEKILLNRNLAQITQVKDQAELIFATYILSEIIINHETEDEPGLQFFIENYNNFNQFIEQAMNIIDDQYHQLSLSNQQFIIEEVETLIYVYLDMFLNSTNHESGEIVFLIKKEKAKETLKLALKFLNLLLTSKQDKVYEKFNQKIVIALSKLVTYSGAYLTQDNDTEAETQSLISEGLTTILHQITKILSPYQISKTKLDLGRIQRHAIFNYFDCLSQIFENSNYKNLECIVGEELFENLITLFSLDQKEYDYFLKSNETKDFFQIQCGSNRMYYKEFAFAFINDLIKHQKASFAFLMFCVQTFKENKNSTDPYLQSKAAAALFILALQDSSQLEDYKAHIAGFCQNEVIPLILDNNTEKLLRFRSIWILETFCTMLDPNESQKVLKFYGSLINAQDTDKLFKAAAAVSIFKYLQDKEELNDVNEVKQTEEDKTKFLADHIGLTAQELLELFIDYADTYPELFEFPNAIAHILNVYRYQINYDLDLIKRMGDCLSKGLSIMLANSTFLDNYGQQESDDEMIEYLQPLCETVFFALTNAFLKSETKQDSIKEMKRLFKGVMPALFYQPADRLQEILKMFFVFFAKTGTSFLNDEELDDSQESEEEKKESENSFEELSDQELLRLMLLNCLYSYNDSSKINRLLQIAPVPQKKPQDQNSSISVDLMKASLQEQILRQLNSDAFMLHFVLYSLQGNEVSSIEEDQSKIYLNIAGLMRVFTTYLINTNTDDLRNHLAYWQVITILLETQTIEDIDHEYINQQEENEPFFLFEDSLKVLFKYLRKLSVWYNDAIYAIYFQIINLYYHYDQERTYQELMNAFEDKKYNQIIFTRQHKITLLFEDLDTELENKFLNNWVRGQLWIICGLTSLLSNSDTKAQAEVFIKENLKTIAEILKSVSLKYFMIKLKPDSLQESQLEEPHTTIQEQLNFIQELMVFAEDDQSDDALIIGMQLYYTSFQSQLDPTDLIPQLKAFIADIKDYPQCSTTLSVQDISKVNQTLLEVSQNLNELNSIQSDKEIIDKIKAQQEDDDD